VEESETLHQQTLEAFKTWERGIDEGQKKLDGIREIALAAIEQHQ
jgi:hypothetical protein